MEASENSGVPELVRRLFTVRYVSLFFFVFCVGIALVSVGITAALSLILGKGLQTQMGVLGQIFESVNAAFSGLGFIALVVTFRLQFEELRLQRKELQNQHSAMDKSQGELKRSAEADIRTLHVQLIKMSMDDEDLAEVWPQYRVNITPKLSKQYKYANLVLQHQRMLYELGYYTAADVRAMLHYLFASPVMRSYWEGRMVARQVFEVTGNAESTFDQIVDQAYRETCPPEPPVTPTDGSAEIVDLDSHRQHDSDVA